MSNDQLSCAHVFAGYGGEPIIRDISVAIPRGKITALIGPNGCGKSTLLKVMGRQLEPAEGTVTLGGRELSEFTTRQFARQLSFLPQQPTVPEAMTVGEVVAFGRYPYTGAFARLSAADQLIISESAQRAEVSELFYRPANELSGGQRQRMWIAMTLAQQSSLMLLDEPTTFLDPAHQLAILNLVRDLNHEGKTIVMVVHDMAHAAKFSDHVVVMKQGQVLSSGPTAQTLTTGLIEEAFGISTLMVDDPETERRLPIAYKISD